MEQNKNKSTSNKLSDEIDSNEDWKNLEQEAGEINIPDAQKIAGQDDIAPPEEGEMADQTAVSAEEEGDNLFNNELDKEIRDDPETNVSQQEREDLARAANDMPGDDEELREAALDSTDEDGTPLNEGSFDRNISGSDLDVPGADLDNPQENIGEEDEENNEYSLGGDNHPDN
jgi:hypothetical protein